MKTITLLAILVFHQAICIEPWTFPPLPISSTQNDADPSVVIDSEGNMTAVWSENGAIMTSDLPLNGAWSMPVSLSSGLTTASYPQLEVDSSGTAIAIWLENSNLKAASRSTGQSWQESAMTPTLMGVSSPKLMLDSKGNAIVVRHPLDPPDTSPQLAIGLAEPKETTSPNAVPAHGSLVNPNSRSKPIGYAPIFKSSPAKAPEDAEPPKAPEAASPYAGSNSSSNAIDAPSGSVLSGAMIGFAPGTAAPSGGAIISGYVGIAQSNPTSPLQFSASAATTLVNFNGTNTQGGGGTTVGTILQNGFQPVSNTNFAIQLYLQNIGVSPGAGITINNAVALFIGSAGGGAGTVTNAYGIDVQTPSYGATSNNAILAGNLNIGYGGISAPTSGAIISGQVGIGTTSFDATYEPQLEVINNQSNGYVSGIFQTNFDSAGHSSLRRIVLKQEAFLSAIQSEYISGTWQPAALLINPDGGGVGIGTSNPGSNYTQIVVPASTSYIDALQIIGTLEGTAGIIGASGDQAGLFFNITMEPSGTANNSMIQYIYPIFNASLATSTTISNAYGLFIENGSSSGGTITNGYSAYITMPAYGSSKFGLRVTGSAAVASGNAVIGLYNDVNLGCSSGTLASAFTHYSYPEFSANTATISNAYGLYIDAGNTGGTINNGYSAWIQTPEFGTGRHGLIIAGSDSAGGAGSLVGLQVLGTLVGDDGFNNYGVIVNPIQEPTTNNKGTIGIYCSPSPTCYSTNTIASAYAIDAGLGGSAGSGTITLSAAITASNSCPSTTSYTIYANTPSAGTNREGLVINAIDSAGASHGCKYIQEIAGTQTDDDGANQIGLYVHPIQQPTNNNRYSSAIYAINVARTYSTNTISGAYGIQSNLYVDTSSGGSITDAFGLVAILIFVQDVWKKVLAIVRNKVLVDI